MRASDFEENHPPVFDAAFWDARYSEADAIWSGNPNPQLVDEVSDLTPGTALEIGCGEGADAIWLAHRGWQVTATELSEVALGRAAAHAEAADVADRITFRLADATEWVPPAGAFDLVTAHFMHLPSVQRIPLHERLAAAVAPGGTLLVVGHHPSDLDTDMDRMRLPDWLFTASDVAAVLEPGAWTVLVEEERARTAVDPEGRSLTIHDAVLRARRAAAVVGQNRS
jgi:SAM-dependent methyltransferase